MTDRRAMCLRCGLPRALPVLLVLMHASAFAQEKVPANPLTHGEEVLAFPSIGRVVFSFIVVAALAVGIAVALRYVLPKLSRPSAASTRLRMLDRIHLNSALRVYMVEVDGDRVLIAEQRGATSMLLLPFLPNSGAQQPSSEPCSPPH